MKRILCLLLLMHVTGLEARTFKSADGSRSFDADFVSLDRGFMKCIGKNGKEMSVDVSLLNEADRKWIDVAQMVVSKSKRNAAFRVIHVNKDEDVVVRETLDAQRIKKHRDPYTGDFLLVHAKSPGADEYAVPETKVANLYWGGTKRITNEQWRYYYYRYYYEYPLGGSDTVLGVYFTSLEMAVDHYIHSKLDPFAE